MTNPMFVGLGSVLGSRALASQAENVVAADKAALRAQEVGADVEVLKLDIERLLMITEALWGILKEKHGYADEELIRRIQEIDMSDGQLDGKVARQRPSACPKCGRLMVRNHTVCLYCGQASTEAPFVR
jgi:hypothetical protein